MNYKLRLVANVLKSNEKKVFIFDDGLEMSIVPVGDGKTVNILVGNDEAYKTKGADAFLKRTEKILKHRAEMTNNVLAQNHDEIFKILALYENSGSRR
jgi:hypothetical protein